ncbi:MAG: RND transporter [Pseudopedobacter saltans]|uniref:RND transporter n=1 Tax=Pseudopedobacter saltans TaxID=151895 RepID=A0A2W5FEK0_9SPHI|nr:MAG: RND transporter [Pseudopedobacter saltans]
MHKKKIYIAIVIFSILYTACKVPKLAEKPSVNALPTNFDSTDTLANSQDTINIAKIKWDQYFTDPNLVALIDTALRNNQELNILRQEIDMSQNEIQERKGEYLPFVGAKVGAGVEKVGRYTELGALEDNVDIMEGRKMPDPMTDYGLSLNARWEIDIWKKLHNATKAAIENYMASVEGKNFAVTNLIGEIASSYYELLGLDNQQKILDQNIAIQANALEVVKAEMMATKTTQLAVKKFEAELLKTKSLQFGIQQRIVETENRINYLLGRYPVHITRVDSTFYSPLPSIVHIGIPKQMLDNRPDIRQAEHELQASQLNVAVAKAQFYPSLDLSAAVGYSAFNPKYLFYTPKSLIYSLAGDLVAPLVNKNAIKAQYANANAKQIQAVYNYQRTLVNAYVEVVNQMNKINNLQNTYQMQHSQVDLLTQSIDISNDLFKSSRADYIEVLTTQRDALESTFDLIETEVAQRLAQIKIYQALGGGWN